MRILDALAKQLIKDMSAHWSADDFRDSFRDEIMKLAAARVMKKLQGKS